MISTKRIIFLVWILIMLSWMSVYATTDKQKTVESKKTAIVLGGAPKELMPFPDDEGTRKIIRQTEIEHEGMLLEKQGRFDEAIAKYQEALDPSLLNSERDKSGGLAGTMRIHQKQGNLDLALKELEWFNAYPNQLYIDTKPELEALIKARDTGSNDPIYAHIEHLKKRYKKQLPPKGHQSFVASDIIRLYDYMGDVDSGIAFVDQVLSYKKLTPSAREEYLKVKQAFIEDKASSTKGRATEALIQSDYFSW